jgi:hypothetical protein
MRWRAPSQRTQLKLLTPILIPMGIVAIGFTLFVRAWEARMARLRRKDWHRWFAWRPVRLGPYRGDPWAWLERVDRRVADVRNEFVYRAPGGMP